MEPSGARAFQRIAPCHKCGASICENALTAAQSARTWVVGIEKASGKTKAGEAVAFEAFATNIFEKDGNRWLMVSHQAGVQPK